MGVIGFTFTVLFLVLVAFLIGMGVDPHATQGLVSQFLGS